MGKQKRGQTTLFIAVDLVILIISAFVFYFRGQISGIPTEGVPFSNKVEEIKAFTQTCIDESVKQGLVLIHSKAGYYNEIPETSPAGYVYVLKQELYTIQKNYLDYIVDEEEIKQNIENAVMDELDSCLDSFEVFNKQGYSVSKNGVEIFEVVLNDDSTVVDVDYPVLIKSGRESAELFDDFSVVSVSDGLKSNLMKIKSGVEDYIIHFLEDPSSCGTPIFGGEESCGEGVDDCFWSRTDEDVVYRFKFAFEIECPTDD